MLPECWRGLGIPTILLGVLVVACVQIPVREVAETEAPQDLPVPAPVPMVLEESVTVVAEPAPVPDLPELAVEQNLDAAEAVVSETPVAPPVLAETPQHAELVSGLCEAIGNKLGSVSIEDCLRQSFRFGGAFSIDDRPLVVRDLPAATPSARPFRVFLMGGIHGDEYSSISIIFKWLDLHAQDSLAGEFHWRIAPLVNPDGLLGASPAVRQNANGVDLNRNFPSLDWSAQAVRYWQESTGRNPRRFPGDAAASEPEVQWLIRQIEEYQPDVIVSVHAPYHLLDFDGPAEAPDRIGELYLHQLGVYPGSLGNYAGLDKRIPVVTLELPSAGIMPEPEQIRLMWKDLVAWLDREGRGSHQD